MPKLMQNLVVLMEQTEKTHYINQKAGNMFLNRFCIDEDAAFELSGVCDLQYPVSFETTPAETFTKNPLEEIRAKGKGYISLQKQYRILSVLLIITHVNNWLFP